MAIPQNHPDGACPGPPRCDCAFVRGVLAASAGLDMAEGRAPTVVRGPWPSPPQGPDAIPSGTGKGWKAMWTAAGDALHQELVAELRRHGWTDDTVSSVICEAADQVRADMPPEANNGITESCIAFAAWCDAFAPDSGLRGLEHMLELRAAARWGDG